MKVENKEKWKNLIGSIKQVLLKMTIKEVAKLGIKLIFGID